MTRTIAGSEVEFRELPNGLVRMLVTQEVVGRTSAGGRPRQTYTLELTLADSDLAGIRNEMTALLKKRKARSRRKR